MILSKHIWISVTRRQFRVPVQAVLFSFTVLHSSWIFRYKVSFLREWNFLRFSLSVKWFFNAFISSSSSSVCSCRSFMISLFNSVISILISWTSMFSCIRNESAEVLGITSVLQRFCYTLVNLFISFILEATVNSKLLSPCFVHNLRANHGCSSSFSDFSFSLLQMSLNSRSFSDLNFSLLQMSLLFLTV